MESSFGEKLKVTVRGGSHEPSVGVSIQGLPAGFRPDMAALQRFLDRRAPGGSDLTTARREPDIPVLISGDISDPNAAAPAAYLEFEIANTDVRRGDYDKFRDIPRPGHADYTARLRYGSDYDMSGGGSFSGRMTAPLCVAGGLALQVLNARGIFIEGKLLTPEADIAGAKASRDSIGGIVECTATGIPGGIGGSMYGGLESRLSAILFGIPAVKGVEFGAGFRAALMKGSENNDAFYFENGRVKTRTNNCGGILGGITTGMPVVVRIAFKPTPSIGLPQESVNLATGETAVLEIEGRHDPCVAVRAVPAVEAAVALGLLDAILVTEDAKAPVTADAVLTPAALPKLRSEIDEIDNDLLALFEQRNEVVKQIGMIKAKNDLTIKDPSREEEILSRISRTSSKELEPYARAFFENLFSLSRARQEALTGDTKGGGAETAAGGAGTGYGLIGHPLPHSFSKEIHEAFGQYSFSLFDLEPEEMRRFVGSKKFAGLCVTRPYKQDVIEFCDRLTDRAKAIGAVNTLYWEDAGPDGSCPAADPDTHADRRILVGHNTDYDGFLYTARLSNIDFSGKTVLILGTGGTSKTVSRVLSDEGAKAIFFATRSGGEAQIFAYENLCGISGKIDIIINTTPVGTYPGNLERLISVRDFPRCSAVIDVIYNPQRTALLMEAESLGLKTASGMPMIVAQAAYAAEKFLGKPGAFADETAEVLSQLSDRKSNIVLIGMPGCGKTTAGKRLAEVLSKTFVDLDEEISKTDGRLPGEIISEDGEEFFRQAEAQAAKACGAKHGQVIATGGGVVVTPENYEALHQNGTIVWLTRPLDELPVKNRPLSAEPGALQKLAEERTGTYEKWADFTVDSSTLLQLLGGNK